MGAWNAQCCRCATLDECPGRPGICLHTPARAWVQEDPPWQAWELYSWSAQNSFFTFKSVYSPLCASPDRALDAPGLVAPG